MKKNCARRAFTLVEATLVLGISGIVLAGIWLVAGNVHNNIKMEHVVNEIWTISNNIRDAYTGQAKAISTAAMTCAGIFPESVMRGAFANPSCTGGNKRLPMNEWDGNITTNLFSSGNYYYFDIDYYFPGTVANNKEKCIKLLSHFPVKGSSGSTISDADVKRADGGPVNAYFYAGSSPTSVRNRSSSEIANLMSSGCARVKLRFRL